MSAEPIANVVRAPRCIADLGNGLQCIVSSSISSGEPDYVAIDRGKWPNSEQLVGVAFELRDVRLSRGHAVDGIWFGRTLISLPWIELLKVADYLQLPIPLPSDEAQA